MAYKACFACELLFEVEPGLGESTRCPQCRGVLSEYDPSADELDGRAEDVAPAPTQANQAIVRTMSYKGLADAVKAQIGQSGPGGPAPASPRAQPRGRGPVPRARSSASSPGQPAPQRGQIPPRAAPPRGRPAGLIPPRAPAARARPITDEMRSMAGELEPGPERERPSTAPLASLNTSAAELMEDTPVPAAPVAARPVPVPAMPAAAAAAAAVADAPRGTKVLDAVGHDDDQTALDAAGAAVLDGVAPREDDSMIEDISMQSMHEDPSILDDISMQSVIEPAGAYDLPATVALQQDPNRPLPPIPGAQPVAARPAVAVPAAPAAAVPAAVPATPRPIAATPAMAQPAVARPAPQPVAPRPAMPSPIAPQPAAPRPAMPQPAGSPKPIAPRPAMPQPAGAQPVSPFGAAPVASIAPAAPAAAPMAGASPMAGGASPMGADAFAPVDFDPAAARKKSSKLPLIIVLVLLVLGGAGAAVWFLVLAEPADDPTPEVAEAPIVLTWSEKLDAQIQAGQAPLPAVDAAAPLVESTWVAGGPEGMSTSLGLVTGMATSVIRAGAVQEDETGGFVPAVKQKLAEGSPGADSLLLLGLPGDMSAADFLRMADSGRRAGHGAFAMVVEQEAGSGKLAQLPFALAPEGTALPETGIVKVRIGTLGLHMTARDAQDKRLAEGQADGEPAPDPRVPMKAGALDVDGFSARLVGLKTAQPAIERVVIHHAPDTKLADLAKLMSRVYQGSEGKKFAEMALVP